jgi:hypothetical protein
MKQPKDKVVILDIISRLDDAIVAYVNDYWKVKDFTQPKDGYNSMQGWGMHSAIWKNVITLINKLPQSRVIITDHTIVIDEQIRPSIYGVRPNKPGLFTKLMDNVDTLIQTKVKRKKYLIDIITSRGYESVKKTNEILKIEEQDEY